MYILGKTFAYMSQIIISKIEYKIKPVISITYRRDEESDSKVKKMFA